MNNNNNEDDDIDSLTDIEEEVLEVAIAIKIYEKQQRAIRRQCYTGRLSGIEFVQELLNGHPDRMYNMFRMDKEVFIRLCYTLEHLQLLENDRHVCIKEAVAMCLYILSHGAVVRVVAERFQRSPETVFTHFKRVLKAFCHLANHIIKPKPQGEAPLEIRNNPNFFPYFEKCIGAIDGTHIAAWSPAQKQISYRDRKTQVTQNIMCACSFDMMFTFVYTGWEGTANDSRVFMDALNRPESGFPLPEEGYYYVVDSGYINMKGFLTPYRGERYHLRDYRGPGRAPRDLVTNDEGDTSRPLTNIDLSPASVAEMNATRDEIAAFMWHDYIRENDFENEIAGGDAEKENVIKVFKDNGLENCLGGDASDTEEVFKICRVFGVDQIVNAMKAFVPLGRVDILKAFLKIFLKTTKRIADVYVAGGPNARLNFLKLQKNLLLSSIQDFEQKTQAVFQTLHEQHQQEWIKYLQRVQVRLDRLQSTVPSNTSLQSWEDQQLNESLAIYVRVHCLAVEQHIVMRFLQRQHRQQSQAQHQQQQRQQPAMGFLEQRVQQQQQAVIGSLQLLQKQAQQQQQAVTGFLQQLQRHIQLQQQAALRVSQQQQQAVIGILQQLQQQVGIGFQQQQQQQQAIIGLLQQQQAVIGSLQQQQQQLAQQQQQQLAQQQQQQLHNNDDSSAQ
ncbi:DDE Tnp4 domain-containing protein [Citrus sinensis]|uniref:DDE Tnp4 domain-containing protein n=1 Tax=Citrus sinensis TaxID=2711 RepID=A0ACB8J9G5_CITSI|nr:DDE Tnp4 domain-containing protein [Citrus sinensis]